ncbi:histidine phosphatase family protein [Lactiplantibacillus garii]|uniref:Histidine phosphatase family protein n=1 Tax=Lactiplantibacillus garii TaxID=2306423 RepID=A0A3R8LJP8_9LACO|nr:histidine phosphatase family protein [Lactiplantibacillus garii]RRK10298.1 histidine phosphatase family protein [Lactiplantibacillus garii]
MATFSVYMIRHGQTYFNKYRRMQGWCDSPLTTVGETDAVNAGKMLNGIHFDAAYASDMTRAMRTAQLMLPASGNEQLKVQPLAAFREAFYGYFEGDDTSQTWFEVGAPHNAPTLSDIIDQYGIEKAKDFCKEADPFHRAENNAEFWERVNSGIDTLRANQKDGDKVLLVSHGNTIYSIAAKFANLTSPDRPQNGSVTKFTVTDDTVSLDYFGRKDHLA